MRADPDWAERPPPDGIERVAGAVILCKRRRAGDASQETPPLAHEQEVDDDSSQAQALREMESMLEEYEESIVRPEQHHNQSRRYLQKRQHKASESSHNYGDPFVNQPAVHDFEISDGSESDDLFEDEGVQYASHPSQSRKNADASTAFFNSYLQPPGTSRQPLPNPFPPSTHQAPRTPYAPPPPPPRRAMEKAMPPPPPPPRPMHPTMPSTSTAHAQQPPFFAAPPPSMQTWWQIPAPPPRHRRGRRTPHHHTPHRHHHPHSERKRHRHSERQRP